MGIGRRLIKNVSFMLGGSIISKLMGVALLAYAARVLGARTYGLYILANTFVFFFSLLGEMGLKPFAVREIAKDRSKSEIFLSNVLSFKLVLSFAALILLVPTVTLLRYPPGTQKLIYLMGLTLIFVPFSDSFAMIYIAFEKMATPAAIRVFSTIVASSLQILVLYLGYGLQALILVRVVMSAIVAFTFGWLVWRNLVKFKIQLDYNSFKELIRMSYPFAILRFLSLAHTKIDVLMLSRIGGPVDKRLAVGYYSPPYSIFNVLLIIPRNLRIAMLPMVASHFSSSLGVVRASLEKSVKFILVFLSFPTLIVTTFFAPQIIFLLFGESYIPSAEVLKILGWIFSFKLIHSPITTVLMTSQRHLSKYIPWGIAITLLNIILNILFIPRDSYIGAAYATLITETFALLVMLYFTKSILSIKLSDINFKLVFPLGLSWGGVWILSKINIRLIAILGVPIYFGMLALFRIFSRKELVDIIEH